MLRDVSVEIHFLAAVPVAEAAVFPGEQVFVGRNFRRLPFPDGMAVGEKES